jgi:imidazolonepropionase-like amidohydrolase
MSLAGTLTVGCASRRIFQRARPSFAKRRARLYVRALMSNSLRSTLRAVGALVACATAAAATSLAAQTLSSDVREFVRVDTAVFALTHVRLIDGTGAAARDDATIVVSHGKIEKVGGANTAIPAGAQVMDLHGYSVIPGLVGMHDHLFYTSTLDRDSEGKLAPPGQLLVEMAYSFPRLYLAAGVTAIRTTGSIETYTDLNLKNQIDSGRIPGPKVYVTGPYLEGKGAQGPQMHELTSPEDARALVSFWADQGATSFKAYKNITRAELGAAIAEAHKRGLKVTGHLCSITYPEAIALGIDNFEHGPIGTDAEFVQGKQPDVCPGATAMFASWESQSITSAPVQALIRNLVDHHVAVTSTLAVYELLVPNRPPLQKRVLDAMTAESKVSYLTQRAYPNPPYKGRIVRYDSLMAKEMAFEKAFVDAGGLLIAGPDPTGTGIVLAGFGDQRDVELLVEGGFSPVAAIQVATANGAKFLGESEHFGTITPGKQADLVVIKGDPSTRIADIENVEIVFKDGIGYDSAKLIQSVRGVIGLR